jgi:superfamily II DNA helicase RecQ
MGIDKSDVQSVIHFDLPKSIENYVQEIGRAGRDGNLARCHMFVNDHDFYELRRLLLTNLLDSQCALKLTSAVISRAKGDFKAFLEERAEEEQTKTKKRGRGEMASDSEDEGGQESSE